MSFLPKLAGSPASGGASQFMGEPLSLAPGFSRVVSAPVRENGFNRFLARRRLRSTKRVWSNGTLFRSGMHGPKPASLIKRFAFQQGKTAGKNLT